jgi:uncharacterized membrane protein YhfC
LFDPLFITHFLNGLLMFLIPIGLGIFLTRRFNLGWRLWLIGGATFILSQVGHIPFNYAISILFEQGILPLPPESMALIFNAVVLGLSAGLWESITRYATYRWWARDARSWSKGVLVGAGHGGVEAIIVGVVVLVTFVNMVVARNMDAAALAQTGQAEALSAQLDAYWNMPAFFPFLGVIERVFAITFHIAVSLMVMQVFTRGRIYWLFLAIAWHSLFDAVAVYTSQILDPVMVEAVLGSFALVSLGIIFALRQGDEDEEELLFSSETESPASSPGLPDIEESPENLDQSRF